MPHTKYQFIGHAIHTGPKADPVNPWLTSYTGLERPAADMQERVEFVKEVLNIAKKSPSTDPSPNTLKVFVLPEFFFRGINGAYLLDSNVQTLISDLQNTVRDAAWSDWFFVFGTILAASERAKMDVIPRIAQHTLEFYNGGLTVAHLARKMDALLNAEIYNFTLCQPGGFGALDPGSRVVMKEHKSSIDFIQLQRLGGSPDSYSVERTLHLNPATAPGAISEEQKKPYSGESIFDFDGAKWGVEVCLDHLEGRLAKSPSRPPIKFQVVPSAGMNLQGSSIVVKEGYVFGCDGLNNQGVGKATADGRAHTELVTYKPGSSKVEAPSTVVSLPAEPSLAKIQVDRLFARGPGELHIYPAL